MYVVFNICSMCFTLMNVCYVNEDIEKYNNTVGLGTELGTET